MNNGFSENPAAKLAQYFQSVHDNEMSSLKLVHQEIKVEAVGFHDWEGHWLGIVVTPWFLNLMLLPKTGSPWPELKFGKGKDIALEFPCGALKFSPRSDPELGSYLSCSLASPMDQFENHAHTIETARGVLDSLKHIKMVEVVPEPVEMPERRALLTTGTAKKDTVLATGYDPNVPQPIVP